MQSFDTRRVKLPLIAARMNAFPRNSIRSFLVHAKSALRTAIANRERVTFVIGNESAGTRLAPVPYSCASSPGNALQTSTL